MSQYNSGSGYRTRPGGSQRDGSRNYGQHSGGRQEGGGGYNKHGGYQQGRKPFNNNRGGYQSQYQARTNVYNQGGSRPNDSLQIWMGDLDPSWTEESIMKIWTSMGEKPKAAKIMRDRNTPPKPSYCFVTFASQQDVSGAMQKNGLLIPGTTKILKLNWASGSAKGNVPTQQNGHPHSHDSAIKNDFSLFVGDLASDVSESMLFSKFNAKYPNQVSLVKIMFDPVTRLTKGFGTTIWYFQLNPEKPAMPRSYPFGGLAKELGSGKPENDEFYRVKPDTTAEQELGFLSNDSDIASNKEVYEKANADFYRA
jgi:hypothetical protein